MKLLKQLASDAAHVAAFLLPIAALYVLFVAIGFQ